MQLFANGDSHTFGSELTWHKNAYSHLLSKKLNFVEITNLAVGGASNDRIIRTTEKYLLECDKKNLYPDFILIGWSAYNRQDWYSKGKYISVPSDECNEPNLINSKRFEYSKTIFNDINFVSKFTKYFHEKIYNLHLDLTHRKIPHLFLNTCISFAKATNLNDLITYDWKNRFYEPYSEYGSFYNWGIKNNYKETQYKHLEQKCHDDFAEILYNYIIKHDLLSCPTDN